MIYQRFLIGINELLILYISVFNTDVMRIIIKLTETYRKNIVCGMKRFNKTTKQLLKLTVLFMYDYEQSEYFFNKKSFETN